MKWSVIIMQSWTSTGYLPNSTSSFVTNCRFFPIIGANPEENSEPCLAAAPVSSCSSPSSSNVYLWPFQGPDAAHTWSPSIIRAAFRSKRGFAGTSQALPATSASPESRPVSVLSCPAHCQHVDIYTLCNTQCHVLFRVTPCSMCLHTHPSQVVCVVSLSYAIH